MANMVQIIVHTFTIVIMQKKAFNLNYLMTMALDRYAFSIDSVQKNKKTKKSFVLYNVKIMKRANQNVTN